MEEQKENSESTQEPVEEFSSEASLQDLDDSDNLFIKVKRPFPLRGLFLIIIIMLVGGGVFFLSQNGNLGFGRGGEVVTPEIPDVPEPEDPVSTYEDTRYGFTVEYDEDVHILSTGNPFTDQISLIQINYAQNRPELMEEDVELAEGYLVRIAVFEGIDRDISDLINRKREKFRVECPHSANIKTVEGSRINGVDSLRFEVENCPQNYVVNMVERRGFVFDITQVYRGDLGFRQNYRAQTEAILRSFNWIDDAVLPTHQTYTNEEYGVEISHPFLDTQCCSVTQPSLEQLSRLIVLADPGEETNERLITDKFGIFGFRKEGKSLSLFINEQKQSLIQEYRVVEGRDPTGLGETRVRIGNVEGIELRNYAWWGDIIIVEHPQIDVFLIVVKPHGMSEEFENVADGILRNLVFLST